MPTDRRELALGEDEAAELAARLAFPEWRERDDALKVGIEAEFFPVLRDAAGRPAGRLPLHGAGGTLERLRAVAPRHGWRVVEGAVPRVELPEGGRLTFEPGGQVELSSAVQPSIAAAVEQLDRIGRALRAALEPAGAVLAAVGVDPWHPLAAAPQQLDAPRYRAMHAYLERRSPAGPVMMRHTASTQINLDLGPDGVRRERWWLANLLSPLLTATFTSSPGEGVACARAGVWQRLDPTRTGFPATGPDEAPAAACARAALDADVMLFWRPDGDAEPGEPGFSFRRWIREGHPRYGWPTAADLEYHLTTLFFEVRVRGFLELRAPDALPEPWWAVPVALVAALMYDPEARGRALDELAPLGADLHGAWARAARAGLRDRQLGALAGRVWRLALAALDRLPEAAVGGETRRRARRFLERYTFRGEVPADELRPLLAESPAASLAWASGGPSGRDDWGVTGWSA